MRGIMGAAVVLACSVLLCTTAGAQGIPFSLVADSARRAPAADARLTYGSAPSQFAEMRLPSGAGPHPVVFLLHGGCWLAAYGVDHVAGVAESLRGMGFAVFAAEYRRVGEAGAGVPGTFDDVRTAYDSLRAIAPRYALDTTRLLFIGHSAGGHLALWLASESGVRVRGVIALAAVTDLEAFATPSGCGSAVQRLMGSTAAAAASPAFRPAPPPETRLVLVTAEADRVVPRAQAEEYRRRVPMAQELRVPGGHFDLVAAWSPAWDLVLRRAVELAR
jgi:acetyl esterase/lipase